MSVSTAPVAMELTGEQKRLMGQLYEKSWDSFITVTEDPVRVTAAIPQGVADVLNETESDLRRSIGMPGDLEREFAMVGSSDLEEGLAEALRAGFGGVIAVAAAW